MTRVAPEQPPEQSPQKKTSSQNRQSEGDRVGERAVIGERETACGFYVRAAEGSLQGFNHQRAEVISVSDTMPHLAFSCWRISWLGPVHQPIAVYWLLTAMT
jgi:hypothetical protein